MDILKTDLFKHVVAIHMNFFILVLFKITYTDLCLSLSNSNSPFVTLIPVVFVPFNILDVSV